MVHHLYIAKQRELLDRKIKEGKRNCINIWNLSHVKEHSWCLMLWLLSKAFSHTFLLFKTTPEVTHHLTTGWTKNNEEWILQLGMLDKITVNCYHGSRVRERLMVKGGEQGLLLGVIGSRTNLAQQPHRGDMVHPGSNWSYPLLGSTVPLLVTL